MSEKREFHDTKGFGAMKTWALTRIVAGVGLAVGLCGSVWADTLFLEEFEGGLTDWTFSANVSTGSVSPGDGDSAVLTDVSLQDAYSFLYRPLSVGTGTLTLEFDFLNGLHSDDDPQTPYGNDESFVGLYFVDDLGAFVPGITYDDLLPLLLLPGNTTDPLSGGVVTNNATIGGDWQHYSITFSNPYTFIIPYFDLNSSIPFTDASFRIDNVRISNDAATPIPLPRAAYMVGMGMIGCIVLAGLRRRKLR
jgi:hypothetical protein